MMNIEDEKGLRFRINVKDHTASFINSPNAKGDIYIPRSIEYQNSEYKITSIEKYAFRGNQIDSVFFPENSEVKIFKSESFYKISFKSLQIPPSLEKIEPGCFFPSSKIIFN